MISGEFTSLYEEEIVDKTKNSIIEALVEFTKPFGFEGKIRAANAELGIKNLSKCVDTLVVIPNDKLREIIDKSIIYQYPINKKHRLPKRCFFHINPKQKPSQSNNNSTQLIET